MAAITGGNIIRNGAAQIPGSKARMLPWDGVPPGTAYAGIVAVGDLVVDVNTKNVYEYTEPAAVPTYTRVDTV